MYILMFIFFFAVKWIFCSWQEDEYPYVGQKCSAESAGVFTGKITMFFDSFEGL